MFVSSDPFKGDAIQLARLEIFYVNGNPVVEAFYSFLNSKTGEQVAGSEVKGSHHWSDATKEAFSRFADLVEQDAGKHFFSSSASTTQSVGSVELDTPSDGINSL